MKLRVNGRECRVLIDTGSTDTIVFAPLCSQWRPRPIIVTTISGGSLHCRGLGSVDVEAPTGRRASVEALIVDQRPLGVDMVLGMSGISALGGVIVQSSDDAQFCAAAAVQTALTVDAPDFSAQFDPGTCKWTVAWKWVDGRAPDCLNNTISEYKVPRDARPDYDAELDSWIAKGWLVPHDEQLHGPPKGLVPLLAAPQKSKAKVRPVMDFRELNGFVPTHTADSDVCADVLRRWRRHGANVAVVDLRKAYLQLHVQRELWSFQTVEIRGQRYCLTRLGLGLNIAPQVMRAVVRAVLQQDPSVEQAVLPYVDDLLVNEDVMSAEQVIAHFARYGLECKLPERAASGARLLGLRVRAEDGELRWARDNPVGPPPAHVTRRSVFAWCGRLVAHLPVCGWLRPAAAWFKRRVNDASRGWDDAVEDRSLSEQMSAVAARLTTEDPAQGGWCVEGQRAIVWTDASSLATGVVVELPGGSVIEDACWLRNDRSAHINMSELDAAIRGVNAAVAWGMREIELRTDSATVHRWVDDALTGRARLRTKAHSEMLIRRRVGILRQLAEELRLDLSVVLVRSAENRADALTRVPKEWLRAASAAPVRRPPSPGVSAAAVGEPPPPDASAVTVRGPPLPDGGPAPSAGNPPPAGVGAVTVGEPPPGDEAASVDSRGESELQESVRASHERAGHPGVRRTLYFARRDVSRGVTRAVARAVVESCDACRSIDPAPVRWRHGSLSVPETWQRIAIDVTHYHGHNYLSIIDCGPSRYCVWRSLRRADAAEVVSHLEQLFLERGAPEEILADNDTVFRGRKVAALSARWRISLRFRAVHEPGGNGVSERCHRSVKVIAARCRCSVAEAVHIYNVTPRDGETVGSAPVSGVYRYPVRDCVRPATAVGTDEEDTPPLVSDGARLRVGDRVWIRRRGSRCTERSRPGTVTRLVSRQVAEIDGVPWHVRDIRPRGGGAETESDGDENWLDDGPPMYVCEERRPESESSADATEEPGELPEREVERVESGPAPLRRSTRTRKPTQCHCCKDM